MAKARMTVETGKKKLKSRIGHSDELHTHTPTPDIAAEINHNGTTRNDGMNLFSFMDKIFLLTRVQSIRAQGIDVQRKSKGYSTGSSAERSSLLPGQTTILDTSQWSQEHCQE